MTAILGKWAVSLAGGAVLCAICLELSPEGQVKGVQKTLCGMVMALALLSPVLQFDFDAYAANLAKYRIQAQEITGSADSLRQNFSKAYIEEQCQAYILDKARLSGAIVTGVKVETRWVGEGVWIPVSAEIQGEYHDTLAALIEGDLGISRDKQVWSKGENNGT